MDREVLLLLESGLPLHWLEQFMPNKTQCDTVGKLRASKVKEYSGGRR